MQPATTRLGANGVAGAGHWRGLPFASGLFNRGGAKGEASHGNAASGKAGTADPRCARAQGLGERGRRRAVPVRSPGGLDVSFRMRRQRGIPRGPRGFVAQRFDTVTKPGLDRRCPVRRLSHRARSGSAWNGRDVRNEPVWQFSVLWPCACGRAKAKEPDRRVRTAAAVRRQHGRIRRARRG